MSFLTGSNSFVIPKNPGPFPTTVSTNEVDRLCQLAEHKQLIIEYETYQGCLQATHMKIIQAIDPEWLAGMRNEHLGFTHRTPIELLNHLRSNGATLDNVDIQELISTMDNAWNPTKNPATKFECNDKIKQQLAKVSIPADPHRCLALFKAAVKWTITFNPAIQEWEAKPKSNQTFNKFCPFIVKEFSKNNTCKLTAQAASYGIANHVDTITPFTNDTANLVLETTAELVNVVSTQHDKKLDDLIKLQMETLAAFQKLLHKNTTPTTTTSGNPRHPTKTNALTASTTILAFPLKNAGNYRPMRPCAPPTGYPWQIALPPNPLDGTWGCMMKTLNFGNREQLIYVN